jgi:hypothetical protein
MARGPWAAPIHGGPWIGPRWWLTGVQSSSRSRPRRLAARVAMRRGRRDATGGPLTGAWTVVRRRRTDSGTLAPSGYGAGVRE